MAIDEDDSQAVDEILSDLNQLEESVEELEFNRMFSNKACLLYTSDAADD